MNERLLTLAAILIEVGIPLGLIVSVVLVPRFRKATVVVLGALSPVVILYAYVVIAYLVAPGNAGVEFTFFAVWVMTFIPYLVCLAIGCGLAFIHKPTRIGFRYALGFASAPFAYGVLDLASRNITW